ALRLVRLLSVEAHADERLGGDAADEAVAAEAREAIALVDDEAGGGDHRVPRDDGRLEFGARRVARDVAQVVVAAFRDLGPAVVLAGLDEVELVAAARAHLVRPEA